MQPQWKGKYQALQVGPTQGSTALTYVYYHPQLGPKFIERIYRDMEPTFFRDIRQGTDWLSQGKFALCFLCRRNRPGCHARPAGRRVEPVPNRGETRDWHRLRSLVLLNRHPHPNGAKVFINWYLSLEGQIAFRQANTDELRVSSLREDLPPEILPPTPEGEKIGTTSGSTDLSGWTLRRSKNCSKRYARASSLRR